MGATLQARGVAAGHGERDLFIGLDLIVAGGDVVGLVGANGAGKTTLLRILAGIRAPDAGHVTLSPAAATIGYLVQEQEQVAGETVRQQLGRRTGVAAAQEELDRSTIALGEGLPGADDAYSDALDAWLAIHATTLLRCSSNTLPIFLYVSVGASISTGLMT